MKIKILVFKVLLFSAFLANLNALELESLQANFTQSIESESGNIVYKGILKAKANSMAYWRYDTPTKKEIFVNKDQIIIYEPMLKQAIISNNLKIDFMKILNSMKQDKDGFKSTIDGIQYTITMKGKLPQNISYKDELDNIVNIKLNDVIVNKTIDNKTFNFQVPEDVEIIFQ